MEAKIIGFFQTVSRLLSEYDLKMDQLAKLKSAVQDHEHQLQICSSIDVKLLKIPSIQERTKRALLLKIKDKIEAMNCQILEIISGLKNDVELLFAKFDKMSGQCENQFVTWALEICRTFQQHYLKCEFLSQQQAENDNKEEEDLSDRILKHSVKDKKPEKSLSWEFSFEEKQHLRCK